MLFSLIKEI